MTTTTGEQPPPPARQSRPSGYRPPGRNETLPTSLAWTATAAPPRQAKQGQISPFHSHQVLIFKIKGIA
jgi:hypothetical protein